MNLASAVAAPSLDRRQHEIGLQFQRVWAARFDCVERLLRRIRDPAIRARSCDNRNGFDYAEISVIVPIRFVCHRARHAASIESFGLRSSSLLLDELVRARRISYSCATFRARSVFPIIGEGELMMDEAIGQDRVARRNRGRGFAVRCLWRMATLLMAPAIALPIALPRVAIAQQDFSKVEIKRTDLGAGLMMLEGAGGNLAVSTGPDGVILVDDQYAPLTKKIQAAIRETTDQPIRFVLNTHWHGDHTGGNENLGEAGALILAHHNVRERLSTEQFQPLRNRTTPASPKLAWPVVTFEQGVTLHLNGQTIEAIHVEPAHTDGDSLVYFREADVLHTGDTFFSGMYPFIDMASGGHIDGMISAADRALALAGAKTRIIPGHGPLSSAATLRLTREMLISVRDRVRNLVDEGLNRAQVIEKRPSREFDEAFGGGFMKPDLFVGIVYDCLKAD
jgi:cyclase